MSTAAQRQEKRIKNTKMKRKLREDPKYREKESQMARRRYKQKQEQSQGLREQHRYQQDLINFSPQKIESMTFQIYELEATLNLTSLEAATTKTTLEKLKMELEQTKTQMNQNYSDTFIERNLCSSFLTNHIKFDYHEFEEPLELVTPHLNSLNTRDSRRRLQTSFRPEKVSVKAHLCITLFWLRQDLTGAAMACIFGLDRRKVTRILRRTLPAIHEALHDVVSWPTDTEFEALKEK